MLAFRNLALFLIPYFIIIILALFYSPYHLFIICFCYFPYASICVHVIYFGKCSFYPLINCLSNTQSAKSLSFQDFGPLYQCQYFGMRCDALISRGFLCTHFLMEGFCYFTSYSLVSRSNFLWLPFTIFIKRLHFTKLIFSTWYSLIPSNLWLCRTYVHLHAKVL